MRYNFFISNSVVSIEIPAFVKNINVKLFEYAWFIDFSGGYRRFEIYGHGRRLDYKNSPIGKNPILENYIKHTFVKLYEEQKFWSKIGIHCLIQG